MHKFTIPIALFLLLFAQQSSAGFLVTVGQKLVDLGSPDTGKAVAITPPPSAAAIGSPCDVNTVKNETEAKKKIDQNEVKSSLTNHVNLSCIDKFKQFSMGTSLGYPDPWSLVQQVIGQACSAADMAVTNAAAPLNQGVALPGGVGRVDTSAVFGSGTSGAGVTVGSGGVTSGGSVLNQGGSGYTVPPLWQ